jgi:hypothetical protein
MIVSFSVIQWWKTHNTSFNFLKSIHRYYKNYYGFLTPLLVSLCNSSHLIISMIVSLRVRECWMTHITLLSFLIVIHRLYKNYYGFHTPLLVSWLLSYIIISMNDRCSYIQYSTTFITLYSFLIVIHRRYKTYYGFHTPPLVYFVSSHLLFPWMIVSVWYNVGSTQYFIYFSENDTPQ